MLSDLLGAIGGAVGGYNRGRQQAQLNQFEQQKLQNAQNETALKGAPEGMAIDPSTGQMGFRSDFYTPGTPAYEAGSRAAELKRESNYRFGGGMPAELAVALQRGQPIPDQYKNYEIPDYALGAIKPNGALMNPNNQPMSPQQQAQYEKDNGLPPGGAAGLTMGALARNQNAFAVGGMAGARQQNQIGAQQQLADQKQEFEKQMHSGRFSAGAQAQDKKFAQQYDDYVNGDRDAALTQLQQFRDAAQAFRNYKEDPGMLGSAERYSAMYLPGGALTEAKNQAEDAASGDLKGKFGSRVSNLDLMTGLKFTVNPKLTAQQNADQIDRKANLLQQRIDARDSAADYYQKNGQSLFGYRGLNSTPQQQAPAQGKGAQPQVPPLRSSLYQQPTPGADQSGGTDQINPAARAASDQKLNIPPNIQEAINDPSQIAKKEFSPSRNKTRITLKNGKQVVLSGDLR